MNLTLCLTHDCNLACVYCYAGEKRHAAMSWSTAEKALEFGFASAPEKLQLGFFGGEPLMEWDLLRRATERAEALASERNIELLKTVTTNATLLTEERAVWMKEHDFFLAVSIDGDQIAHDATRPLSNGDSSFATTLQGLEIARDHFPALDVVAVADPANIDQLEQSVRFLAEDVGVQKISINPNFSAEWSEAAKEQWTAAFHQLGAFYLERFRANRPFELNFINSKIITRLKEGYSTCDRCSFGEQEMAVAPSGNMYPCERLVADDRNPEMCIGTVFEGFDSTKRNVLLRDKGNSNAECSSCTLRERCMNWCGCINYATTGHINQTDGRVCFHERLAIEVADAVANTLYTESNPAFLKQFYYT